MKAPLLTLAFAGGLMAAAGVSAQALAPQRVVAARDGVPPMALSGVVALQPRELAQLSAIRNPEVRYSRMSVDVAGHLAAAEAALYETVFFGNLRGEDRERQRTVEERIASAAALAELDERGSTAEAGLRQRLPTAGEFSASYRIVKRRNNIIASTTGNQQDTEYTGGVVLSFKQPLLRNFGREVLETDRRIAALEHEVQWAQFRQQVLKSTADALNLYWQLHRAQQAREGREESLRNVRRMAQDVAARIEAGRSPPANTIEVRSSVLTREAELARASQGANEAEGRLFSLLSLSASQHPGLRLRTVAPPPAEVPPAGDLEQAVERALQAWPPYLISKLRLDQARQRLLYARNQLKPQLDFSVTWASSGLAYERTRARQIATTDQYPEWVVGLNFEMPLAGNGRAGGQYEAQAMRVRQNELELEAIRTSLTNDLAQRRDELEAAIDVAGQLREELRLRQTLLENERERFTMGLGQLSQWIQREDDVVESRQRLAEAEMRVQLARVAWQFAQGSLLDEYDIALRNE